MVRLILTLGVGLIFAVAMTLVRECFGLPLWPSIAIYVLGALMQSTIIIIRESIDEGR